MHPTSVISLALSLLAAAATTVSAANLTVDASSGRMPISPLLYGKNGCVADDGATSNADITLCTEAGVRFTRHGGGNNCTKYNWRAKLSSHPDWYNNVYAHDWDLAAQTIQTRLPAMNGMFALQLLGWVASNADNNFDANAYNGSAWWSGVSNNWAGGGGPTLGEGNANLYLKLWPADSTVGILPHWFGAGGQSLDTNRFRYWNMDNEPEIWNGTHDDIQKDTISAEAYMQKYFAVAKKARAAFPGIKLCGPVFTNEWQWWTWNNHLVGGLPWMAWFIKRIGEEQAASGVRLLDVVDFHFYPDYDGSVAAEHNLTQLHRVWYDTTYAWPWANGSHMWPTWDASRNKQYIFLQMQRWLDQYLGQGHGVKVGVSECGFGNSGNPNGTLAAVWYASMLGTFADHGVAYLTPWYWYNGQWEVLHLFSRYAKATRVASTSSLDSVVSAYSSVNNTGDSLTVILINRDKAASQQAVVTLANFTPAAGAAQVLELSSLPADTETFVSHANNRLKPRTVTPAGSTVTLTLPAYSVTAVMLKGTSAAVDLPPSVRGAAMAARGTRKVYDLQGRLVLMTKIAASVKAAGVKVEVRSGERAALRCQP